MNTRTIWRFGFGLSIAALFTGVPDLVWGDSTYPVHPHAKAAVEAVLDVVWEKNTTPKITGINISSTQEESSSHRQGRGVDINEINGKKVILGHTDFVTHIDHENMKTWVTALQDAFLADCRVKLVLGPVRNENKSGQKVPPKAIEKHKDHIHITVYDYNDAATREVRTCE